MVDEKTYPAEGDRGQGLLLPLVEIVRKEEYLLPSAGGKPATLANGYCKADSLSPYGMPYYSVEAYRAGEQNKLYSYFVQE